MVYILFIGLGLCILFTPQNALHDDTLQIKEVNNESDDDKLNQALILVDILKTEYVKLLRQNIQLRNGDESVIDEAEQATCAANATEAPDVTLGTTNGSNGNQVSESSTNGSSAPLPAATAPTPAQPSLPGPAVTTPAVMAYYDIPMPAQTFPLHNKQYQAPRRYFRRRIPDYYYYDIPRRRYFREPPVVGQSQRDKIAPYYRETLPRGSDFRRFDYDNDPFNDTPTTVLTTSTQSTATTTTAVSPTAAATASSAQESSNATTVATTPAAPAKTSLSPSPTTKTYPPAIPASSKPMKNAATVTRRRSVRTTASTISPELDRQPLKGKVHHKASVLNTKDPVDAEVASELVNELKEEGITLKKINGLFSTNPTADIFDPAFKTSMRIYLEKSTRYPIPLPENHAFCFTNPNNPLCRTFIR